MGQTLPDGAKRLYDMAACGAAMYDESGQTCSPGRRSADVNGEVSDGCVIPHHTYNKRGWDILQISGIFVAGKINRKNEAL